MEYKIGKEARCAVIGYGSWATAIVGLLAANESPVWMPSAATPKGPGPH